MIKDTSQKCSLCWHCNICGMVWLHVWRSAIRLQSCSRDSPRFTVHCFESWRYQSHRKNSSAGVFMGGAFVNYVFNSNPHSTVIQIDHKATEIQKGTTWFFLSYLALNACLAHLAWADFKIKVKRIAHSTVHFDQWSKLHLGLDALSNQKILNGVY